MENVKELLKKIATKEISNDDIEQIDTYYSEHIDELLILDNDTIASIVETSNNLLSYSLIVSGLRSHIFDEEINAKCFFDEDNINDYNRYIDLCIKLDLDYAGFSMSIANYYLYNSDKTNALRYYELTFKPGFQLNRYDYYDHLINYLDLSGKDRLEIVDSLIKGHKFVTKFELDYVYVLLLRAKLTPFSDIERLNYVNKAIEAAQQLVDYYRSITSKNYNDFSNSEEEQALCEAISHKLEYYVKNKDYVNGMKMFHELTEEIGRSDCTKYYHFRDYCYKELLEDLSKIYPEIEFCLSEQDSLYIEDSFTEAKELVGKEITLRNGNNATFKYKVNFVDNSSWSVAPVLPLVGTGKSSLKTYKYENNQHMLVPYSFQFKNTIDI